MKLGIMQPYFFPYLGYFSLIKNTDHFVFFDTPQYVRRSWMNRNRILNANGEVCYISVPLKKAPQRTAIKDMEIDNSRPWAEEMIAKFVHYKRCAPFYKETVAFFEHVVGGHFNSLSELNIASTIATCEYLGLAQQFETFSTMGLTIANVNAADEWALEITKAMNYEVYVNPPGGKSFFDQEKYKQNGIELQFLQVNLLPYDQHIAHFESGLSILDVLMFNPVEKVKKMLDDFQVI